MNLMFESEGYSDTFIREEIEQCLVILNGPMESSCGATFTIPEGIKVVVQPYDTVEDVMERLNEERDELKYGPTV